MAITTAERTNILKLVVAMFNAPAGSTYLSEITSVFEANGRSLSALAQTLSTTGAFKALHPNFQSSSEFAAKFLTPYGLQNNAIAVDWVISKLNAGVNKGQIALEAATAIDAYTGTDAGLIAAKSIQNNKTAVAEYYS
ncbi:MAG: Hemolysin-type calcium-binding repeat-containing protein, partial [Polaromonas sp.]|nr:Hemolysin-type calcium-binding repeat-containing protein [Polaromonas sp.]